MSSPEKTEDVEDLIARAEALRQSLIAQREDYRKRLQDIDAALTRLMGTRYSPTGSRGQARRVLKFLEGGSYTAKAISEALGIKQGNVYCVLSRAFRDGKIEKMIEEEGKVWKLRK